MDNDKNPTHSVTIPAACEARLRAYALLLGRANERARLTGPSDPEVLLTLHMADACAALALLPQGKRFIDVGTGGGLPGMVWAICRPDLFGTLLDSISRKTLLLAEMAGELGLENVEVICRRSEDFARLPGRRESYDVATARAVASSEVLAEYLSPLVKVGGRIIAFKGASVEEELKKGGKSLAWGTLGLSPPRMQRYVVAEKENVLVIWKKIRPCPARFPRTPGMASKKPL